MLKSLYRFLHPKFQKVYFEYPHHTQPRLNEGLLFDKSSAEILKSKASHKEFIEQFFLHVDFFKSIAKSGNTDQQLPLWQNGFFPGLDIVTTYSMLPFLKPKKIIEIGSGTSTKVMWQSIVNNKLDTKFTAIDPHPRSSIEALPIEIINTPFEELPSFDEILNLEANDILFIDSSHRAFANSDVTLLFLEIIPFLKPGVVVQVHDIYIPFDYPDDMCKRFYNEQYLLMSYLISGNHFDNIIFPTFFASQHEFFRPRLDDFWRLFNNEGIERHGGSFWFRIS